MKKNENLAGRVLKLVAAASIETTSVFCFYEPVVPTQLQKKQMRKNGNMGIKNV